MAIDEFQSPGAHGGQQSHNGLDLSAVDGGLTTRPASGVGPQLVSRSWSSARLSVELDAAGVGPRNLDVSVSVDGKRFPGEVRAERDGRLIVETEFPPSAVPSGTHAVRVRVEDGRGETATVDAGRVQIFGMMGDRAAETPEGPPTTTATGSTTSTDATVFGLSRERAVVGGAGAGVIAAVLGGLLII